MLLRVDGGADGVFEVGEWEEGEGGAGWEAWRGGVEVGAQAPEI